MHSALCLVQGVTRMVFLNQILSLSHLGGFSEQKKPQQQGNQQPTSAYVVGEVFWLSSPGYPFTTYFVPMPVTIEVLSRGCSLSQLLQDKLGHGQEPSWSKLV